VGAHVSVAPPLQLARVFLFASAVALGTATVVVVPRSDLAFTTHAGASVAAEAADLAAGLSLLGAGLLVALHRSGRWSDLVVVVAGLAWFAPDWVGWDGGPPIARSAAMVVEPFFPALVFHVVLGGPGGRLRSRPARMAVGGVYAIAAITSAGRALFRDPFLDPYCWNNCTDNVFLVSSQPTIAKGLRGAWIVATVAIGLALALWAAWRLATATTTAAQRVWPILVPGFFLGMETSAHSVAMLRHPVESSQDATYSFLFLASAWSAVALALGICGVLVRARRARLAVALLASDLGEAPPPGSLGAALARATGDPGLEVVYSLPGEDRYVDASGRSVDPPAGGGGRAVTPIVREGREIALVVHDATSVDAVQLRSEIGAAARLAVENERLQAEVLAQLEDLRASRVRIVETGDAERRRLERNLHDGAQQRLLALSYDLRLARVGAEDRNQEELAGFLRSAGDEAQKALIELRDLAHGISPAVLTEAGIGPALWTVADSAPLPVEVGEAPDERFPQAVERTAFVVATEAIDAAHRRGSGHVAIRVFREDDRLIVEAEGSGPGPFVHLADRVGAMGGHVTSGGQLLRAVIPCA
jgi:signal transduction histidine kinase